jgi:two-component system, chemotaxis family, chemotaxis protein CheY
MTAGDCETKETDGEQGDDGKQARNGAVKILIVGSDDNERAQFTSMIEQLGFKQIKDVGSALAALHKIEREEFDLVLCDCDMPDVSGIELLKIVRSNDVLKHIPFVMIGVLSNKEDVIQVFKAGATDYIVKPFTKETLNEKFVSVLSNDTK